MALTTLPSAPSSVVPTALPPMSSSKTPDSTIDCAWLLADPGSEPAQANMRIGIEQGRIASTSALASAPNGPRRLALPALANAHDHARTFRSATLGAANQPLESWLPFLGVLPGVDPYLCAVTSFARSARNGVAHLMVHYNRIQGIGSYLDEAAAVARAARDVGIRIGFAVSMRDRHGIGYDADNTVLAALRPSIRGDVRRRLSVPVVSPSQQLATVDDVARMVDGAGHAPYVNVQYGPTAAQWCSQPLLAAIAGASADTGRGVHMHFLETRYQREWADQAYPQGILRHLDAIGLLSPRLTLAHCTWARPQELALLAERGVTIAVNTSSNLGLRSGIAPLVEMIRQGCRVAMGLDGLALDEDDDALREMRLAWLLHRGWGFDDAMTARQLWAFAAQHGRRTVGGVQAETEGAPGGRLTPGAPADLLLLDWETLDDDALFPGIDPLDLLLARAHGGHIDQLIVGGRTVVRAGQIVTVDEAALRAELLARMRAAIAAQPQVAQWQATVGALAEDLGPFYKRGVFGCC